MAKWTAKTAVTPADVNSNLPARLSDTALKAAFVRRRMYDVRDYLGSDDIGAAVNRAITAAASDAYAYGKPGQVVLPPGSWAQTTPILRQSYVDIFGSGEGRTVLRPQGGTIAFRRARTEDGITSLNALVGCTLAELEIDGSQQTSPTAKGMYEQYLYRCEFHNLYIHDTGASAFGQDFLASTIVQNVRADGGGRVGGPTAAGCSGLGIGTSGGGFWAANVIPDGDMWVRIINCSSRGSARGGLLLETQAAGDRQTDIVVTGFTATGCGHGIIDAGCDGAQFIGGRLYKNTGYGFIVNEGTFGTAPSTGINGLVQDMAIRENTAGGVCLDARTVAGGSGYRLSEDRINLNHGAGVSILAHASTTMDLVSIARTDVFSNDGHGIYVTSAGAAVNDLAVTTSRLVSNGKADATHHGFRADCALTRPQFVGNKANDTAGTKTQQFGFSFGASVFSGQFDDNYCYGNAANANLGVQGAAQFDNPSSVGANPGYTVATGTPSSVVSAPVGTLFRRTDGGATTTLYVKESGPGASTGWVAK